MIEVDIREIDRELLSHRLAALDDDQDYGVEWLELSFYAAWLYLVDEGIVEATEDGRYFIPESCPACPA